jgi:hypothetical protein
MVSASKAAVACASAKPLAVESTGTNSKLTRCAMVIITCWSFALGPMLTNQILLPGNFDARFAAS